jgi:4-hydroxybenzoate polyprenyltransferase
VSTAVNLRHRGLRVAYVFGGSTGAWMGHLFFASSFVQYSCNAHGTLWYQYVATAFFAAVTVHAMWIAYGLHKEGHADDEDAGTRLGANNFIGLVGILVCAANLLLILGEGSFSALIRQGCHA